MKQPNSISVVIKATLLLASTLTVMAGATIAPSLPAMQKAFADVPNAEFWVRLVLTLPGLFIVIGAPFAGALIDKIGRKSLLIFCGLLYAAAGASGFWFESLWVILIGRALLGFAVAGIMTSVTTLIADYLEGAERARILGLQGSFMSLGGVVFLLLGGFLAEFGWRLPFLIYLFALILMPFFIFALFEPVRAPQTAAEAAQNFWRFALESRAALLIYAAAFVGMTAFYLIPVQMPFYLSNEFGASAFQSGIAIAVSSFCAAMTSLNYRTARARLSYLQIYSFAFVVIAASYLIIGFAPNYWIVLCGLALSGVGNGFLLPNASSWLTEIVPDNLRGRSVGALTMAFFLGQFLSPFVSQPLGAGFGIGNSFIIVGAALFLIASGLFFVKAQSEIPAAV